MVLTSGQVAKAYERFGHLVLRRCRAILRDEHDAMDAMQEVFVRLMRYGKAFERADQPVYWLYQVANRVCFDALRSQNRFPDVDEERIAQTLDSEDLNLTISDRELVMKFLERFDVQLQRIAMLYFVEELSQSDIAGQLGLSRQTIHKKLSHLRKRAAFLQQALGAN